MAREFFNAYHSYLNSIEPLNDAERGRLFTALLQYSKTGEAADLRGNERFVFPMMKEQIDRDVDAYAQKCEINRINGRKGGKANAPERPPNAPRSVPNAPQGEGKGEGEGKGKGKGKGECIQTPAAPAPAPAKPARNTYGQYGWVKLTESEYNRLLNDLGEAEVKRCIAYVDESAQSTGNKNKWQDWNLVVRKCSRDGWGLHPTGLWQQGKPSADGKRPITDFEREAVRRMMEGS